MKKYNIIAIALIVLGVLANSCASALAESSEPFPDEEWNMSFGEANASSGATAILQTSDGGYIVAGWMQTGRLPSAASWSWLFKMDAKGNMQWNRTFERKYCNFRYDHISSVLQTSDGGYILAGSTNQCRESDYDPVIWLIKTDANGYEQWNRTFGEKGFGSAYSVIETGDGYIIAGNILLIKTDKNGNEVWSKVFEGQGINSLKFFGQSPDGGFTLVAQQDYRNDGKTRAWLIKTDPMGNLKWDRIIEEQGASWFISAQKVKDGYLLLGYTENYTETLTRMDIWLIKADEKGDVQWKRTIGERGSLSYIQMTEDGGYLISGVKYPPINRDTWVVKTWLIKTDDNGNVIWNTTFGEGDFGWVVQTSDRGYIIIGYKSFKSDMDMWTESHVLLIKVREKAVETSGSPPPNNTLTSASLPEEKPGGFEMVLSITIIMAVYLIGWKRR